MTATKTIAGTSAPKQPKNVDRQVLIDFVKACGIDPGATVSLHVGVNQIIADQFDGARTIVEIK